MNNAPARLLPVILAGALLAAGCAPTSAGFGTGVVGSNPAPPLPETLLIVAPRPDLANAPFSGKWEGVWFGWADQLRHTLVVETLSEQTFNAVYAVGDSMAPWGRVDRRWTRLYGSANPGKLVLRTGPVMNPHVIEYVMNADGTMTATLQPNAGPAYKATMKKAN